MKWSGSVVSPRGCMSSGLILRQAQDEDDLKGSILTLSLTEGEGAVPGNIVP